MLYIFKYFTTGCNALFMSSGYNGYMSLLSRNNETEKVLVDAALIPEFEIATFSMG